MLKLTQKDMVYSHLIEKGSITPKEALEHFNIYRLAAVVHSLKKEGVDITTELVAPSSQKGMKYARYHLATKGE